ncbi:hypothetical protein BWI93_04335 [Siphonobacter sp. BAB-5385]|uniref:hypothetical protein n=1 Tax=unclassified Siphonobacter TaxID=2635712 RepID=UPI000B9E9E87|nr:MULTISPECIES: hypothetical protein [unclassified Siphonobacter]OZI09386.1 hypothetical protein BWI93_04335 [Siphonobacter sp. BAB-5385]PMD98767.1 hypothetical protein BWI97_02855 [Siphonobacter sp. BAB-5405]
MENAEKKIDPNQTKHQQNPSLSSGKGEGDVYHENQRVEVEEEGERPKKEPLGGLEVIPNKPNVSYTASDEEGDIIRQEKENNQ